MANQIKAGNTTNGGTSISSDTSGTLEISTGPGAGTTAVSIDASQAVSMPGAVTVGSLSALAGSSTINNLTVTGTFSAPGVGGNYAMTSYVAPATWTKPAGLKAIKVTVVGAGGNGSGGGSSGFLAGGGGGGGGAAIEYIPAPAIPGPVSVTAGSGTNSFGAFCSATAGSNSSTVSSPAGPVTGPGGAGGSGSGGTYNIAGQPGGTTNAQAGSNFIGAGGNSLLGFGAQGRFFPATVSGSAGGSYGGGASGAARSDGTTSTAASGAPGIVIVEEFY